ncbi:hypothetical protein [Flexibacter flexilis]|uniref:hypothetical protein n=1 Tax=Flexibacter flexilis TaxID=998 RepID=UPI000B813E3A|nr:hypothetical protein [Flexibacter flexilis]
MQISFVGLSQTRPNATVSYGVSGVPTCVGCSMVTPNYAWDSKAINVCTFNVSPSYIGGYGEAVYSFAKDVPFGNEITLILSFENSKFLTDQIEEDIFKYLMVELQDATGKVIKTYDRNSTIAAELLNEGESKFALHLMNSYSNVRRIKVRGGSLYAYLGQDIRLYDISHAATYRNYTTSVVTDRVGIGGQAPCVECAVQNPEAILLGSDPNTSFAKFRLAADSLATGTFAYAAYDWQATYDGMGYDLYFELKENNTIQANTKNIVENQLQIVLTYTDTSSEVVYIGHGSMSVEPLYNGSERMLVRVNAADDKMIDKVEIQVLPSVTEETELLLFNIYAGSSVTTLPVTLAHFEAARVDAQAIDLDWITQTELNSKGFELQKSTDGQQFRTIANISGKGTASTGAEYSYTDHNAGHTHLYYRLKQVDDNGEFTYSPVKFVAAASNDINVSNVIFETDLFVTIDHDTEADGMILLLDAQSHPIYQQSILAHEHRARVVPPSGLPTGNYILEIVLPDEMVSRRVVKQ